MDLRDDLTYVVWVYHSIFCRFCQIRVGFEKWIKPSLVFSFLYQKSSNDKDLGMVSDVRTLRPLILIKFHEAVPEAGVGRGMVLCRWGDIPR